MIINRFKFYKSLNISIQKILYRRVNKYHLNLADFFKSISDIPYIALKLDVPYMVNDFPNEYPIGKDIDLIVEQHNLPLMIDRTKQFSEKGNNFKVKWYVKKCRFKVRFEFMGELHYQIDVRSNYKDLSKEFISESIIYRSKKDYIQTTPIRYEVIYRLVDLYEDRYKKHHVQFIANNIALIEWYLFDYINDIKVKKYFQDNFLNRNDQGEI